MLVDVCSLIRQGIPLLGGVVAVALVGWVGFLLVRKCFRWISISFGCGCVDDKHPHPRWQYIPSGLSRDEIDRLSK